MNTTHAATPEIARLHDEWEAVHGDLRKLEQVLSECLELYVRGLSGPPDHVIAQVEAMRADCTGKFQELMAAVKSSP